ncbi:MAG: hypothetical protein J3K34DRAFT_427084 [Monoraphidium minutum]|nr:MAG: hypothetical protein J3K34DRAFT_427084 [Monoraphidium minutum]
MGCSPLNEAQGRVVHGEGACKKAQQTVIQLPQQPWGLARPHSPPHPPPWPAAALPQRHKLCHRRARPTRAAGTGVAWHSCAVPRAACGVQDPHVAPRRGGSDLPVGARRQRSAHGLLLLGARSRHHRGARAVGALARRQPQRRVHACGGRLRRGHGARRPRCLGRRGQRRVLQRRLALVLGRPRRRGRGGRRGALRRVAVGAAAVDVAAGGRRCQVHLLGGAAQGRRAHGGLIRADRVLDRGSRTARHSCE